MLRLEGKNVLITGASTGIGHASGAQPAQQLRGVPFLSSGEVDLKGLGKSIIVRDPDGHAVQVVEQ